MPNAEAAQSEDAGTTDQDAKWFVLILVAGAGEELNSL
jgi:hypothetical protein